MSQGSSSELDLERWSVLWLLPQAFAWLNQCVTNSMLQNKSIKKNHIFILEMSFKK